MSNSSQSSPFNIFQIGDIGWDDSTEIASIIIATLSEIRNWRHRGNIVNLFPAKDRAVRADRTWKTLGLKVPVAAGISFQINPLDKTPFDESTSERELLRRNMFIDGPSLFEFACNELEGNRLLNVINTGGFPDIAELMVLHGDLFQSHVASVTVMGGVELEADGRTPKQDASGNFIPDWSGANSYNRSEAEFFYRTAKEWGIPIVCVTRDLIYASQLDRTLLSSRLKSAGSPLAKSILRLQMQQRGMMDWVWAQCHLPEFPSDPDMPKRELPLGPRDNPRTREWFIDSYISPECRHIAAKLGPDDSIYELTNSLQYGGIIAMAADPNLCRLFFVEDPITSSAIKMIGGKPGGGIRNLAELQTFFYDAVTAGFALSKEKAPENRRQIVQPLLNQLMRLENRTTLSNRLL